MPNAIIIHGTGGHPEKNWFPWLKKELEALGCKVYIPQFPTPQNQSLKNWFKIFAKYKKYLNQDSIMVGRSLGVAFILNLLESINHPIKAAFLIAGFARLLDNPDFDPLNQTFVDKKFAWTKIKKNCRKFYVLHSDNDPYVPLDRGEEIAKNLGVKLTLIKGAGHFNTDSGYTKFEFLLEKIKSELNTT